MKSLISDSCQKNMHESCEDPENCHCGCHTLMRNIRGKNIDETIRKAVDEEMEKLNHFSDKFRKFAEAVE